MNLEYQIEDLPTVCERILQHHPDIKVWLLNGEMGAGKTTFVKALAATLCSEQEASSPTFTLVNEYSINSSNYSIKTIYHFDLYRLKDEEELYDIGINDYLQTPDAICVIEWPEKIIPFLENPYLALQIEIISDNVRKVNVQCIMNN